MPCSDSESQSRYILPLNDFHENRLPNCLSSVGDLSPRDELEDVDNPNSHQEMNKNENIRHNHGSKDTIIAKHLWPQIYKAAQAMINNEGSDSNQAQFISQCAVKIMKIVSKATTNDKSLDTLQLEYEEKEIQNKLGQIGESFISESDIFQEQYNTPSNKGSFVVKNTVKDQATIKNLKKQFLYDEVAQVTRRNKDEQMVKNEIKTTAASSKRKKMAENNSPVQDTLRSNEQVSKPSNIRQIETSITKRMMDIDHVDTHLPINNRGK